MLGAPKAKSTGKPFNIMASHAELAVARTMEVRREEYLDYMTFKANRRPLFTEIFGPLPGVKAEWAAQGASPGELDLSAFRYRRAMNAGLPVNLGYMGGQEEELLEETESYILARDRMGRTVKLSRKASTIPLPQDWPVKTMDDWQRIKHHYAWSPNRVGDDLQEKARAHREAGRVVCVGIPGGFDQPRQLMGDENVCLAFLAQPELIEDMLDTIGEMAYRVLDEVSSRVEVDALMVHEDMAGISGPMVGPDQVRTFIKPYYRRVWDLLRGRGARLFMQDSDGDMRPVLDAFIEAGLNAIHPLEPKAGMDIVRLREKYGTALAFEGGIDKFVLQKGRDAITAELEYKIPPLVRSGGCVFGLDHRIPNGTPLDAYRFYIDKVWEIMDREAGRDD